MEKTLKIRNLGLDMQRMIEDLIFWLKVSKEVGLMVKTCWVLKKWFSPFPFFITKEMGWGRKRKRKTKRREPILKDHKAILSH